MTSEKRIWGIHSQDDLLFLNQSIIAIGWEELGDLSQITPEKEEIRKHYQTIYPDAKKMNVVTCVGSIARFFLEMQVGDYIVFPSKFNREINLGIIAGEYYYDSSANHYNHRRKVEWIKHLPRAVFTQGALYEVGAFMACFLIKNYANEYMNAFDKGFKIKEAEKQIDETIEHTAADIEETTKDFILKELSKHLKGYDLEYFTADLLNAMGYRTIVSPHGGDSGIDIIAYKDELPPRILVQVKSQDSDIKETTIQSLKGAMREGDYGLFITLSNYTKNAAKYLDNTPIIRGINGSELVELILRFYDKLSDKYKKMIPLKMVYIPVCSEE